MRQRTQTQSHLFLLSRLTIACACVAVTLPLKVQADELYEPAPVLSSVNFSDRTESPETTAATDTTEARETADATNTTDTIDTRDTTNTTDTIEVAYLSDTRYDMPFGDAPTVVVMATRHSKDKALINDFVSIESVANSPANITELLSLQPGLNANGQPGLFQTLSIRGLARQRVHAYVNGMRITSERRAGVAASFIDPLLLSGAEVTQGPASTYYGSGAIAGSVHLVTRQDDGLWFNAGLNSDGNETVTAVGNGGEDYVVGVAFRQRDNGETITGEEKNNHFSQFSTNYQQHFELDNLKLDWQLIYSRGDDLGKDNLRYPDSRITTYPEENHLLSQVSITGNGDWQARLYFHDQNLQTRDERPLNRVNLVETESLDLGFSIEDQWRLFDWSGLIGFDYFARQDVNSRETETDLTSLQSSRFQALLDGEEQESAVFATINQDWENWAFHGGLRLNYQTQSSASSASLSDDYVTYFTTVTKAIDAFEFGLSYGTGFRFASLSERLFSGTTGRGQTIGNPDLKPEESQSLDLSVKFQRDSWLVDIHRFETDIDNFIERVSIDEDTRTYRNVTQGNLSGWKYQVNYAFDSAFKIDLSGQSIDGEDQLGNPLADVPPDRHRVSASYETEKWFSRLSLTHRLAKDQVGDGEVALDSANIGAATVGWYLPHGWAVELVIENLFDETYFNAADDLSTLASGREFAVNFSYRP